MAHNSLTYEIFFTSIDAYAFRVIIKIIFLAYKDATNVNYHCKICLIIGSFEIDEIKYLSILPDLPLTLLTCCVDYLAFAGNKPY